VETCYNLADYGVEVNTRVYDYKRSS